MGKAASDDVGGKGDADLGVAYQEFHVYDDEIEGNVSFAEENIANLTSEENKNYLLMVNSDDEILNVV